MGEFLELLRRLNPEQARELVGTAGEDDKGSNGAEHGDPKEVSAERVSETFMKALEGFRRVVKMLPQSRVGAQAFVASYPLRVEEGSIALGTGRPVELRTVSVEFTVPLEVWETSPTAVDAVARRAAAAFASRKERLVVDAIVSTEGVERVKATGWSEPGKAVEAVAEVAALLEGMGFRGPYLPALHPKLYAQLLAFHERSGVMELARVERLARTVVTPFTGEGRALLLAADSLVLDVVVDVDTRIDYLGLNSGGHTFRAWETVGVRVFDPKGVVVIEAT